MNIYRGALEEEISPSLRTASSLVTDWESEPDGLKVFINWKECSSIVKCFQVNNFGVNLTLITEKPLNKRLIASEVSYFNLTQTSPKPHLYLIRPLREIVRIK